MDEAIKHKLAHPHDLLVRNVLSDTELAADLLQNYLDPGLVSRLDWNSLQREDGGTVDTGLSKLVGDLRFSARFKSCGGELKVFVFLEHQSRPDRLMSFRMLEYVCAAYRQQAPGLKRSGKFPYPLAVVLHHGEKPWKRIPPMRELVDMTPGATEDILGLPIHLIDVAAMPLDELRGHPMVCALLDSLQSASMGVLPMRMPGIFGRLRGVADDWRAKPWVKALGTYYTVVRGKTRSNIDDFTRILTGLYNRMEAGKMATSMYEDIVMEGVARGRTEGRVEGKIESVLTVLDLRFGEIPAGIRKKLMGLRDGARIEGAIRLAATCQSFQEFQKAL
jgi:hypothetical protein